MGIVGVALKRGRMEGRKEGRKESLAAKRHSQRIPVVVHGLRRRSTQPCCTIRYTAAQLALILAVDYCARFHRPLVIEETQTSGLDKVVDAVAEVRWPRRELRLL